MKTKETNKRFILTKKHLNKLVKDVNGLLDCDITIRSRKREIVEPRQIVQGFLYNKTLLTGEYIGKYFGMKHAAVIHSANLLSDLDSYFLDKYPELFEYLKHVELKYSSVFVKRNYYISRINKTLDQKSIKSLKQINKILTV